MTPRSGTEAGRTLLEILLLNDFGLVAEAHPVDWQHGILAVEKEAQHEVIERAVAVLRKEHHPVVELDYVQIPPADVTVCASCYSGVDGWHMTWPCPTEAALRSLEKG